MKNNSSLAYSFSLLIGDFFALLAAFVGAYVLRVSISNRPISESVPALTYLELFLVLLPFWLLIFALMGLYNSSIYEKRFVEAGRLFVGSFLGLLFVTGVDFFSNTHIFPAKLVPIYGFILAFVFLLIFRNIARSIRSLLFAYDIGITNVLILGNTKVTHDLIQLLQDRKTSGYRIVGVVIKNKEGAEKYSNFPIFGTLEEAISKIRKRDLHSIVQTELYASSERNNDVLEFAQTNHISYRFVPGNSELFVGNIQVELFRASIPVIAVHQTALIGWGRVVKRVTDIVFGSLALIVALPFMLLITVAVKLFDPKGPVIHKDARLTRFGNKITMYKFRSMKHAYSGLGPEEAFAKMGKPELIKQYRENGDQLTEDPRISKIGLFLRSTSLDELPQLFNIIKGDISFVGPRALHPFELEKYAKKDLILAVKSGLTGLAQVSGRRDISFEERRSLDLYYVQNWSFWMDITILIKTIRVVLRAQRGKLMKVAIVCDWLTGIGGAERVVLELHKMYPDAPIYTSQYDPKAIDWFKDANVQTLWLQKLPKSLKKFLPVLRARAFKKLDLSEYDLVLTSSGAEAKGVKTGPNTLHIWYCHAPTHYYWSRYKEYLRRPGFGVFNPLARLGLLFLAGPLRRADYKAAQKPNFIIVNSEHTKSEVKKYYSRESTVIHPPVDVKRFKPKGKTIRQGFVIAGRQTPYKRFDLAVAACSELNVPLKVIGKGPDHEKLVNMAGPRVTFLTSVSDDDMPYHFQRAEAFIFPGIDDFGIVAVEAMAAGTPVIAYKGGGSGDYVIDGISGILFDEQNPESLIKALKKITPDNFKSAGLITRANKFRPEVFSKRINLLIEQKLKEKE